MNTFKKVSLALVLGGLGCLGLRAEEYEFSAKFQIVNPQGDMRTFTKQSFGYGAELGADLKPTKELGVGVGAYVSFMNVRGKSYDYKTQPWAIRTYDMKSTTLGLDVIYQVGEMPLFIRTGPMLTAWDITNKKPFTEYDSGAMGETSRYKLGWRVGAEYRISEHWAVAAFYNQSSFGNVIDPNASGITDADLNDPLHTGAPLVDLHPSWVAVQVGYKF